MLKKQAYSDYLAAKYKNPKQREEYLEFFDQLNDAVAQNKT